MSNEAAFDALLASAKPRTKRVRVCAAGDLVSEHEDLMVEVGRLAATQSLGGDPRVREITDRLAELEAAIEEAAQDVVVSSIGRHAWADLLAAHPPRDVDRGWDHNRETFPPAAVAAATGIDLKVIDRFTDETQIPAGEWDKLWDATWNVNVGSMPDPKAAAAVTELVRASEASSTQRPPTTSPAASSSDDSDEPSPSTSTQTES